MTRKETASGQSFHWLQLALLPLAASPSFGLEGAAGEREFARRSLPMSRFVREAGTSGWWMDGLWHRATGSSCAPPAPVGSHGTMYFGWAGHCDYETGGISRGDLVSPLISGITEGSVLSFDSFRDVELSPGPWDRTELAVSAAGGPWEVRWALDSSDAGTGSWTTHGPISLARYAGEDIRLRFRFDSVDEKYNGGVGWLIDNVHLGEEGSPPWNTPAVVWIDSPADGSSWEECSCIPFTGLALDSEDGDLSAQLRWSLGGGELGVGRSIAAFLPPGTHTILVELVDSGGLPAEAVVDVVIAPNLTSCSRLLGREPVNPEPHILCPGR